MSSQGASSTFLIQLGLIREKSNLESTTLKKTFLLTLEKRYPPVFAPFGVKQENWPTSVALFTGIFAKEAVVGTVNALYSSIGDQHLTIEVTATREEAKGIYILGTLKEAVTSVKKGLYGGRRLI